MNTPKKTASADSLAATHTASIQAVLFDLDGTLLDTAPDFVAVLNQLRSQHGHQPLPFDIIREKVSEGARALVTLGFAIEPSHPHFDRLHQQLLSDYQATLSQHSKLFDGMNDTLLTLEENGLQWGIVTNKPSLYTEALLEDLGLAERCAVAICPDHVTHPKPHPEPIQLACSRLNCSPHATLYVGDHRRDIEAGNRAEAHTLAVTWGYADAQDPPQTWGASSVIDQPIEILHHLHLNQP